jgi:hypothetical protein
MVTIACIHLEANGFTGEYVERLRQGVEANCSAPHDFVVVKPVRPLTSIANKFWIKLELFRKGLFDGPVIYLDLDTVLVNDVTDIFTHPWNFMMGHNWEHYDKGWMASGIMGWDGTKDLSYLDVPVTNEMVTRYRTQDPERWGDQGFIQDNLREPITLIQDKFPNRYVSYKLHCETGVPEGSSIVAFHGNPRPHEINWEPNHGE